MELTVFGFVFLPLLVLTLAKPGRLLSLAVVAAIFDAASVLNINLGGFALGVQPGFATDLLFLTAIGLRYLAGQSFGNEKRILYLFWPMILFCFAAAASAILLPRLFAGHVYVWPQRTEKGLENVAVPLYFSSGNITQLVYLLVNASMGILTAVYLNVRPDFTRRVLSIYLLSGIAVSAIGLWQWTSKWSGIFFPSEFIFSNPNWADNTNQTFASTSIYRISGPFSEPSFLCFYLSGVVYASFWAIVSAGPTRLTVIAFLSSLAIALMSTSTTGYAAVAIGVPLLFIFKVSSTHKWVRIAGVAAIAIPILLLSAFVVWRFFPKLVEIGAQVLNDTLEKGNSESYEGRHRLDRETFNLVFQTFGLGAGWGSVRASSLVATVVGATGIWGPALVLWFAFRMRRRMQTALRAGERATDEFQVMTTLMASLLGMVVAAAVSKPDLIFSGFWINLGACVGLAARARDYALAPGPSQPFTLGAAPAGAPGWSGPRGPQAVDAPGDGQWADIAGYGQRR
ncbi:MAG: hypothetical protein JWL84_5811 [Rhodospirillales bacterium]|nr:hypothetical protein [Rhodospirillales bacterium]